MSSLGDYLTDLADQCTDVRDWLKANPQHQPTPLFQSSSEQPRPADTAQPRLPTTSLFATVENPEEALTAQMSKLTIHEEEKKE